MEPDAVAVCRAIGGVVRYLGSGVSEMGACSQRQSAGSCNSLKTSCKRKGGEVQTEES